MNTCPKCGGFINQDESFCKVCGTKIERTTTSANATMNGNSEENVTNNSSSDGKRKFNKNAICSIAFSIISLFIFWWLSLAGIGTGITALSEIKKTNEKGKVLAIIGITIGVIGEILYWYFQIIAK
jgi:hypothetical protein